MRGVVIRKFEAGDTSLIDECARLYVEVWREPPWNETHWRFRSVRTMIYRQLNLPQACGLVAEADGRCVGFAWGYYTALDDLSRISSGLDFSAYVSDQAFYLGELAVALQYRRQGLGRQLTEMLLAVVRPSCPAVLLRTDCEALVANHLYAQLGFKALPVGDAQYPQRRYCLLVL